MVNGFDFKIDTSGELVVNAEDRNIEVIQNDDLRIQLAYNRIKSVTTGWYYDDIGANLEELVGKPVNTNTINTGKNKILNSLTFDELWDDKDILIKAQINNALELIYSVYLKIYSSETEEESSVEIIVTLDLIKGVKIKFGWE